MKTQITDTELNDLTHAVADLLDKFTDARVDPISSLNRRINRMRLNDILSALLAEYGVENVPDDDEA